MINKLNAEPIIISSGVVIGLFKTVTGLNIRKFNSFDQTKKQNLQNVASMTEKNTGMKTSKLA